MSESAAYSGSVESVEDVLREELARNGMTAGTIVPILRHLLANEGSSIFSDEVVARVRGMIGDLTRQLLDELASASGEAESGKHDEAQNRALGDALVMQAPLLFHVHALALEWQLTERLQARLALDPVLSPLMQSLVASADPVVGELAMNVLAAQARFCQAQRRMKLSLVELPGDLLHAALLAMRATVGIEPRADACAAMAETLIRNRYDESRSRIGLLSRLVTGLGGGAIAALAVNHAGVGIFLTALSIGSAQDRDATALSTNEAQLARLALGLRAAGLKPEAVEEQFMAIHPEIALPPGFERLGADRAAAMLAVAGHYGGS